MEKDLSTPMMKQWHSCKQRAKGALLFFRLGDFYEAFYEDAHIISKELDLILTKRQNTPMCGVPVHTHETYVDRLLTKGHKIAIAEQLEDPKNVKGLVKRDIIRILTPGTVFNSSILTDKSNNFFASIDQIGSLYGISYIDLTTSEFKTMQVENQKDLISELYRLRPKEFLVSKKFYKNHAAIFQNLKDAYDFTVNQKDDWYFDLQMTIDKLTRQFKMQSLNSFGLDGKNSCITSSGCLLQYLNDELNISTGHIKKLQLENLDGIMSLDHICSRNLEIFEPINRNSPNSTLLFLLDKTNTSMGGRLLKQWLKYPLYSIEQINQRQEAISDLLNKPEIFLDLDEKLSKIKDLERLIMKIVCQCSSPKDFASLKNSLLAIIPIRKLFLFPKGFLLNEALNSIKDFQPLIDLIDQALVDNPPLKISDGDLFKEGYSKELDSLNEIYKNHSDWIAGYQNELRNKTDIKNLKVGYTRIFGYYIEVSRGQAAKTPDYFQRKQTLVNAERFTTEELKEFEYKVLTAEEQIGSLELTLFENLRKTVAGFDQIIFDISKAVGFIDVIFSFAKVAKFHHYCRPIIDESAALIIKNGRHPVIANSLSLGEFIPNDTFLHPNELSVITGPNMAGKSTYIRQIALIVIMAQIGSFVPADYVKMGLVDKIFSRIGASDDLSRGQSTFMVEMTESANILNNATEKSLIILDEIGRGTSTYDGLAIAWSVAEYLINTKKAKTLFATHYWELTNLEKMYPAVSNYNIAVEENSLGIVFLRKIVKGSTDKSYGIHVAKLAGLPIEVIQRAKELLKKFEKGANKKQTVPKITSKDQLELFYEKDASLIELKKTLSELKKINVNSLSPLEALQKLFSLQEEIGKHEI